MRGASLVVTKHVLQHEIAAVALWLTFDSLSFVLYGRDMNH